MCTGDAGPEQSLVLSVLMAAVGFMRKKCHELSDKIFQSCVHGHQDSDQPGHPLLKADTHADLSLDGSLAPIDSFQIKEISQSHIQ